MRSPAGKAFCIAVFTVLLTATIFLCCACANVDTSGKEYGLIPSGSEIGLTPSDGAQTSETDAQSGAESEGQTSAQNEENTANGNSSDSSDSSGKSEQEESFDISQWFDTTVASKGLYRCTHFEFDSMYYFVYVQNEKIGNAIFDAEGEILLDCDLIEERAEIWGKWDESGSVTYYLLFLTFPDFKEFVVREHAFSVQIDLTREELAILRGDLPLPEPKNDVTTDPARCAECGATYAADSSHLATCSKYAEIPEESAASDFLRSFGGMVEKYHDESVISDEYEYYSLKLTCLDRSAYADLILALYKDAVFAEMGPIVDHINAQIEIESKIFNVVVDFESGEEWITASICMSYFAS